MNLFLAELPGAAELIDCKTWLDLRKTWTQTQTDQSLKIKAQRLVNVGMIINNNNNNGSEKLIIEIPGKINLKDIQKTILLGTAYSVECSINHIKQGQRNPSV